MYSILIFLENEKWEFLKNTDGTKYIAETLVAVQEKVKETLRVRPLNEVLVVKNCTITESITVTENTANQENNEETPSNEQNEA